MSYGQAKTVIFRRTIFWKLVLSAIFFNGAWMLASQPAERLYGRDKGLITGIGFILLYAITFFVALPAARRKAATLLTLVLGMSGIFAVSGFVIVPLFLAVPVEWVGVLCSSLFSAISISLLLHRVHGIYFLTWTMVLTFISAFTCTCIFIFTDLLKEHALFLAAGYASWQLATSIVLAAGIALRKDG